jgi:tRNA(Ile)-lysidine synthase
VALIMDHGLRQESAAEAALAARRMTSCGIPSTIVTLDIAPGAALQARARTARHRALADHAAAHGAMWLLLGHHAGDQAELWIMRGRRGQGGAAGIAPFAARHDIVLLRPLLGESPAALREELTRRGIGWIEDPSNSDPRFERARIRAGGTDAPGEARPAMIRAQTKDDRAATAFLARRARVHPAGYATLRDDAVPPAALAALIRVIGGAEYPPAAGSVARLAGALQPATLGGVQIMRRARSDDGWLLCREAAACAPPVAAEAGAVWDGRFRIRSVPHGASAFGALGSAASAFRSRTGFVSVILRGLPAFFSEGHVVAVPHCDSGATAMVAFQPPAPARPMLWADIRRDGPAHADRAADAGARG